MSSRSASVWSPSPSLEEEAPFWWNERETLSRMATPFSSRAGRDEQLSSVEALMQQLQRWKSTLFHLLQPPLQRTAHALKALAAEKKNHTAVEEVLQRLLRDVLLGAAAPEKAVSSAQKKALLNSAASAAASPLSVAFSTHLPQLYRCLDIAWKEAYPKTGEPSSPHLPPLAPLSGERGGGLESRSDYRTTQMELVLRVSVTTVVEVLQDCFPDGAAEVPQRVAQLTVEMVLLKWLEWCVEQDETVCHEWEQSLEAPIHVTLLSTTMSSQSAAGEEKHRNEEVEKGKEAVEKTPVSSPPTKNSSVSVSRSIAESQPTSSSLVERLKAKAAAEIRPHDFKVPDSPLPEREETPTNSSEEMTDFMDHYAGFELGVRAGVLIATNDLLERAHQQAMESSATAASANAQPPTPETGKPTEESPPPFCWTARVFTRLPKVWERVSSELKLFSSGTSAPSPLFTVETLPALRCVAKGITLACLALAATGFDRAIDASPPAPANHPHAPCVMWDVEHILMAIRQGIAHEPLTPSQNSATMNGTVGVHLLVTLHAVGQEYLSWSPEQFSQHHDGLGFWWVQHVIRFLERAAQRMQEELVATLPAEERSLPAGRMPRRLVSEFSKCCTGARIAAFALVDCFVGYRRKNAPPPPMMHQNSSHTVTTSMGVLHPSSLGVVLPFYVQIALLLTGSPLSPFSSSSGQSTRRALHAEAAATSLPCERGSFEEEQTVMEERMMLRQFPPAYRRLVQMNEVWGFFVEDLFLFHRSAVKPSRYSHHSVPLTSPSLWCRQLDEVAIHTLQQALDAAEAKSHTAQGPTSGGPGASATDDPPCGGAAGGAYPYLPLAIRFLLRPTETLEKLLHLARLRRCAVPSPTSSSSTATATATSASSRWLLLEENIQTSGRVACVMTDQRSKSLQRAKAYDCHPCVENEGSPVNVGQAAVAQPDETEEWRRKGFAATVFFPRYLLVFSQLTEGLQQLAHWISTSPQHTWIRDLLVSRASAADSTLTEAVLAASTQRRGTEEEVPLYRLLLFLLHQFFTSVTRSYIQFILMVGRSRDDPSLVASFTELLMFFALITRETVKSPPRANASEALPSVSAVSPRDAHVVATTTEAAITTRMLRTSMLEQGGALGFLAPSLSSWFSWNASAHFMRFLQSRIVRHRLAGLVTFFLPSLRAIGVDDSVVEGLQDLMLVAFTPFPTPALLAPSPAPSSCRADGVVWPSMPPPPVWWKRMSAELVFVQELPRAGYCSNGRSPLALQLKDDALEWWDQLLFQYFDSEKVRRRAIRELEYYLVQETQTNSSSSTSSSRRGKRRRTQDAEVVSPSSATENPPDRTPVQRDTPTEEEHHRSEEEEPPHQSSSSSPVTLPSFATQLLTIVAYAGSITIQRALQRSRTAAALTTPASPSATAGAEPETTTSTPSMLPNAFPPIPRVLEVDVLRIFFTSWWRLCDECHFRAHEETDVQSVHDVQRRYAAPYLCRQRVKEAVVHFLALQFGVPVPPSFVCAVAPPTHEEEELLKQQDTSPLSKKRPATTSTTTTHTTTAPMSLVNLVQYIVDHQQPQSFCEENRTVSEPPQRPAFVDWLFHVQYEDLEFAEMEKVEATTHEIAPAGGPKGLLRRANNLYNSSMESSVLLYCRKLLKDYGDMRLEGKQRHLHAMHAALRSDGQQLNTNAAQQDDQKKNAAAVDPMKGLCSTFLGTVMKAIRLRSVLSPAQAAGAGVGLRYLLLEVFASAGFALRPPSTAPHHSAASDPPLHTWIHPLLLVEQCGKLSFTVCKYMALESKTNAGSASSSSAATLGEITGSAILLRILVDTLAQLQGVLEARQKERRPPPPTTSAVQLPEILAALTTCLKHLLQDLTSAMRSLILTGTTRADAAVLLLTQQFQPYLAHHPGYAVVVAQAKRRLSLLRGNHLAPSLPQLLALSIPVAEVQLPSDGSQDPTSRSGGVPVVRGSVVSVHRRRDRERRGERRDVDRAPRGRDEALSSSRGARDRRRRSNEKKNSTERRVGGAPMPSTSAVRTGGGGGGREEKEDRSRDARRRRRSTSPGRHSRRTNRRGGRKHRF